MKIIKSDGRHQLYKKGMRVILEFDTRNYKQRARYWELLSLFKEQYGEDRYYDFAKNCWVHNPDWRALLKSSDRKIRRIFIKDEAVLSHILLLETVNTQ